MKKPLLLLPGPMQPPDFVDAAATKPLYNHRSPEMLDLLGRLEAGCRPLFGTAGNVLFLASSGTGAMESAVVNLTSPGDEILVVVGGEFSSRWISIGNAYNLVVRTCEVDTHVGAVEADIEKALQQWPNANVIFITWSESSTGVLLSPETMTAIGRRIRSENKILVADAVSGVAVSPLAMDAWNVDAVIAGSQKGFMIPAGLGFAAVGPRAWEKREISKTPRFYWDWKRYVSDVPFTPAQSILFQLEAALEYIHRQGMESVFARRAEVAARIRELVVQCGMEVYARNPGNGITAVVPPSGFDMKALIRRMNREFSIQIAGGLGALESKIFRIGHVGHLSDAELEYFIESFRTCVQ